jgi:4-carboxymuconolactone decarboxylase
MKLVLIVFFSLSTLLSVASAKEIKMEKVKVPPYLESIAPDFAKLTQDHLFGDIWERKGLSKRDKSLVTISVLVALNRSEQLESHLKRGLDNGLTKDEIVTAIQHMAYYAGWPVAVSAYEKLDKVLKQQQ